MATTHCTTTMLRRPLILSKRVVAIPSRSISIFGINPKEDENIENSPTPLRILARCEELHASIQPLNDRVRGPLERHSYKTTALPFVLLLGNHSSGKSSFVNYILQRQVQTSGVAPTDDSFTVIAPGKVDIDQDGPSLVGDPDMGFSGLRHFGPPLVHHMQLKIRKETSVSNFMLVDSPGMIDSPITQDSDFNKSGGFDRGYDFEGTVKWFAERADVILLFFDPDKPGTTGETLRVMTKSLAGTDHKLHIVLNKADQFKKIHDFARAYGSLCWNLSKVIPRKDLPRIHTMCLPVTASQSSTATEEMENMGSGLADLHKTRDVVVSEVFQAPKRRIDNMITRLADSVQLLSLHATISDKVSQAYKKQLMMCYLKLTSVVTVSSSMLGTSLYYETLGMEANLGIGMTGLLTSLFTMYYTSKTMEDEERRLLSVDGLNHMFESTYAGQISEGDAWILSDWSRIRDRLQLNLRGTGLKNTSNVSSSELKDLKNILDEEIPKLRRLAAPIDYSEMVKEGFSK